MLAAPTPRLAILLLALTIVSCSSGLRIVDTGFTETDLGEGRWAVKLDSTDVRSDAEAEANLMVHLARWTIDHGASYFTIHELVVGSETKFRTDTDTWHTPSATSTESGTVSTTTEETRSSRLTTTSEGRFTARANIILWPSRPEKPEGELYDASKVLDKYSRLAGRTPTSRITVKEKISLDVRSGN